jgi:putative membrane protein insertion efficiency factor
MREIVIFVLRLYKRWLSPALPASCRYVPSCSEYAIEAVELHGPLRGSWMALQRLLRCHPFVKGGYDPVLSTDYRVLDTSSPHLHSHEK